MAVDVSQFDSVEDLDVYFKKQKAKAPDDEAERAVDAARLEARASFFEARSTRASLEVAKRDALDKYPLAKEFPEMITGKTPEEITTMAKTVHERLEARLKTSEQIEADKKAAEAAQLAQARQQYGQPAAAGGTSQPPSGKTPPQEAWDRVMTRVQKGDGGQDSAFKRDFSAGVGARIAEAADAAVRNPSYRSFNRPGTPDDRKIADDRTKRKG